MVLKVGNLLSTQIPDLDIFFGKIEMQTILIFNMVTDFFFQFIDYRSAYLRFLFASFIFYLILKFLKEQKRDFST